MRFDGEYATLHNYKYHAKQLLPSLSSCEPVHLSAAKLRQLSEQHWRYTVSSTDGGFRSEFGDTADNGQVLYLP